MSGTGYPICECKEQTVKTAWNKADLLFLMDALRSGVAQAYVARFLGRSPDEVRDRAKALKPAQAPRYRSEKVAD